jgi:NAD-dependent deacetylase
VLAQAVDAARAADLFLVVGSSLVVQPAASLPEAAKHNGARLVIVNREATPLDPIADLTIRASIGGVFVALCPQLVN